MPCYDSRNDPAYIHEDYKKRIAALEERCDTNARVACEALRLLEANLSEQAVASLLSRSSFNWWEAHKKFDKKRK